jgi:hypothetical protein
MLAGTVTRRVHRARFRFFFVGMTQRPFTLRPAAWRLSVSLTVAEMLSV